ncbi:MAG: sorbosone dehydrogenase family protein [Amphiplicatus sp.]
MRNYAIGRTRLAILIAGMVLGAAPAGAATLSLQRVAGPGDIANPVHAAAPVGDTERLFMLDRASGDIKIYNRATGLVSATPFLTVAGLGDEGEQGAYALAFAPDYATSGKFYVSIGNAAGDHQVVEYTRSADPNIADPASARVVITVPHPADGAPSHYGGWIGFGPDGYLYVTTGDSNADPIDNAAQVKSNLLGSVLRIDPSTDAFPGDSQNNFSVPADNPFLGDDPADDAVWAYGLRNPFRAAFDPASGAFFIADVGEDRMEEINLGAAGANYGWPGYEGSLSFLPAELDGAPVTFPIFEYPHEAGPDGRRSITGGEFYQGPLDSLDGFYFFGDFLTGEVWSFLYDAASGTISDIIAWELALDEGVLNTLVSFARDGDGNLYILDITGGVWLVADAEIPAPAGLPLMIAGLASLWGWRRKRARALVSASR